MVETRVLAKGEIRVPPNVDTRDFADMESLFRDVLWPRTRDGWQMLQRTLTFNKGRTKLFYHLVQWRNEIG